MCLRNYEWIGLSDYLKMLYCYGYDCAQNRDLCGIFGLAPYFYRSSAIPATASPVSRIHSKSISVRRKQTAASFKWSLSEMTRQFLFARIP
jgi:hypothetical protein